MAFTRIKDEDLDGRGVIGLPDIPGLSTEEMQRRFDEIALEVLRPAVDRLMDELEAAAGAGGIGAVTPEGLPEGTAATVQGVLDALNAAIDAKVQALGAGDMAQSVYDPLGKKTDVFRYADEKIKYRTFTVPASGWTASGTSWVQTVSIAGMTAASVVTQLGMLPGEDATTRAAQKDAFALIARAETVAGGMTLWCDDGAPTVDLPLGCFELGVT